MKINNNIRLLNYITQIKVTPLINVQQLCHLDLRSRFPGRKRPVRNAIYRSVIYIRVYIWGTCPTDLRFGAQLVVVVIVGLEGPFVDVLVLEQVEALQAANLQQRNAYVRRSPADTRRGGGEWFLVYILCGHGGE